MLVPPPASEYVSIAEVRSTPSATLVDAGDVRCNNTI
jgi:hypothetical protein